MKEPDKPSVVFTEPEIHDRIRVLGRQITQDYAGREIAVIGLLPNTVVFMADLIRAIDLPLICDFLKVEISNKRVDIAFGSESRLRTQELLLLQGVVDTGVTMNFITEYILEVWKPRSLKVAALIDREVDRKLECCIDYACFKMSKDVFVVGYGLAYQERYRGIRYLGSVGNGRI